MAFEVKIKQVGGLRIVMVPDPGRESVLVSALVGAGSREESKDKNGVAHFLEHYILNGTARYPGIFGIKEAVEGVGGAFNAFTGHDQMGFWVKMDKKHLSRAVDLVGQMVGEPQLQSKYMEKERGTILQEVYMYEDDPQSKVGETAWRQFFGNTGLGRSILGTVESLQKMTISDLQVYFKQWFDADNMVVGVVGDFDEAELCGLIEKSFRAVIEKTGESPERDVFDEVGIQPGGARLVKRKLDQAHVAWIFLGVSIGSGLRYAAVLLNTILGGSWGSRLMKEVREKKGWAYSIGSDLEKFADAGVLMIGAGLPKDRLKDALGLTDEIIFGLTDKSSRFHITAADLQKAKDYYLGRISLHFDDPDKVLSLALHDSLFEGKVRGVEEVKKGIESVTLEQIYKLGTKMFDRGKLGLAVVGDYDRI